MTLSEKLTKSLKDLGLNPNYVEKIARETIAEDLAGGVDVTSKDRKSTRLNSSHT